MSSPTIGLKNLVYALMTTVDDGSALPSYGTIISVPGIQTAKVTPKVSADAVPGDDVIGDVIYYNAYNDIEMALKYIPLEVQADWLGHSIANGTIVKKNTDIPPFVALGYKTRKANGKYVYKWHKKVQFQEPDADSETLSDKANPKYPTIKGMALPRIFDSVSETVADEDATTYTPSVGANWFTAVDQPLDTTPPTVSSVVPTNGATAVARTTTVVWTFSENLLPSTVGTSNFYLLSSADGSIVAATVVYNDTAKTVTLTPSAQLAATTKYIAVVDSDVTDRAGNHFVPSNTTFTTGS